ncbi:hypothetical protein STCU_11187 [Strigomonas culicis]|uniref:Uncharacterized protein n=1 Tax=Strigomonas culicis TaxID=28005 RepID=S9THZ6_9TRYP|nr:hypothetical protein STCU_11187 [Strigomonas culicis]|eukprot:EPY16509.1 hypothetical protein STCU_11187 [Strigomonas culicis]
MRSFTTTHFNNTSASDTLVPHAALRKVHISKRPQQTASASILCASLNPFCEAVKCSVRPCSSFSECTPTI